MSFPTTSVLDSFTRANATGDNNWSDLPANGSALKIVSNQAASNVGGQQLYFNRNGFGNDQEAYVTIATLPSANDYTMLYVRLSAVNASTFNGYRLRYTITTNAWIIERIDAGTATTIASGVTQAVTAGQKIGLSIVGTTLTGYYYNGSTWASKITVTDATYSSGKYIGMGISDTTARLDDFGGGTVGGTSDSSPWTIANTALFTPNGVGANDNGEEPCVLVENGKFRMWWRVSETLQYSECLTSADPTVSGNWTTTSNILGNSHGGFSGALDCPNVFRDGSTLRLTFLHGIGGSLYSSTSTDGITWTTPVVAIANNQVAWINGLGNSYVWKDGSTYRMICDIEATTAPTWAIAYAESTDGVTYTLQGSGPITSLAETTSSGCYGGAFLLNNAQPIGGLYWLMYQSSPTRTQYPTNIVLASTPNTPTNTATWTVYPDVVLSHDASSSAYPVQVADPCAVEVNGLSYLFTDATNGDFNPRSVMVCTYPGTLAQSLGIGSGGGGSASTAVTSSTVFPILLPNDVL